MPKKPQVIFAGAGPVGLLTALALAKQDVSVLVLEAEPGLTVGAPATHGESGICAGILAQETEAHGGEDRGGAKGKFQ